MRRATTDAMVTIPRSGGGAGNATIGDAPNNADSGEAQVGGMTVRRRKILAATLVLLFLAIPLCQEFEWPAAPMDEGFLLVYPELILKAQVPYRDFETFYGPGNPYALSAVYAICGSNIFV